ncbi:MAG: hypothetical protein AB1435_08470, partial [Chloroflexota bacterium]
VHTLAALAPLHGQAAAPLHPKEPGFVCARLAMWASQPLWVTMLFQPGLAFFWVKQVNEWKIHDLYSNALALFVQLSQNLCFSPRSLCLCGDALPQNPNTPEGAKRALAAPRKCHIIVIRTSD